MKRNVLSMLFVLLFSCMYGEAFGQVVIRNNQKVVSYGMGEAELRERGVDYFVMELFRPENDGTAVVELGNKEQTMRILTSLLEASKVADKDDEIILNNPSNDVAIYKGSIGTFGVKAFHIYGNYMGAGVLRINALKHFIKKLAHYKVNGAYIPYQYGK